MNEITLMNPSKATDNKLRWSSDVDGVKFQLYIPQGRVPKPWPRQLHVTIAVPEAGGAETRSPGQESLEKPIACIVEKVAEHTETVHYRPLGDQESWELGEPYIPFGLLPDEVPSRLLVQVVWDRTFGTWSK
ncbi:MAG: hypothetical protein AB7F99_15740 [Vicinamibacterales bacterium]